MLRIGQVWTQSETGRCLRIMQIHRADRMAEASCETSEGSQARAVTFDELRRRYTLVD